MAATTTQLPADPPLLAGGAAGLSSDEAAARWRRDGPNRLPRGRRRSLPVLVVGVLSEPLLLLLVGAALLYALFGEPRDALLLAGSVGVIITLDILQEHRAERTLEALQDLSQPTARVLRDGRFRRLPSERLVVGDWVLVGEGERVPADARLRSGEGVLVDESLLTGESVPVRKVAEAGGSRWSRPGGDDRPFLYAGTLVVRGQGLAEVAATGRGTEMSRIAVALATIETGTPLLRRQTRGLIVGMAVMAVAGTALVALGVGLHSGDWIAGLLAGTAIAIGLLPEEIPVVLTLYSILGARRMARHRALARKFGTIPTLGAVTLLLTDKTGTLTENRMRVAVVEARLGTPVPIADGLPDGADDVGALVATACLASEPESVDPTEQAITELGRASARERLGPTPVRVRQEPFTPATRSVTNVWAPGAGQDPLIATKGAPESVIAAHVTEPSTRAAWLEEARRLSASGLRVLGVAGSAAPGAPASFLGLIGLADPLRPGVPQAVAECRSAGIRVVMITGDHPETARAIAREAGFARVDTVLTGPELRRRDDAALRAGLADCDVYSRIAPEEKLRLVRAFRDAGEVVAMTGDGVNDAPALRAADVGIAMGGRGTDVAREAASLVLLDDAFPTIVEAIRMGRRIHGNMRKAINYLVPVHVALAGMALLPVLLGLPILLYPVEIVFIELIVDPTSSLALEAEPEESDLMRIPPRLPDEPLVGARPLAASLVVGATGLAASFAVYLAALALGRGADESRSLSFATLVVANLAALHLNRSYTTSFPRAIRSANPIALGVTAFGAALLLAALYLPGLEFAFSFAPPSPLDLGIASIAGVLSVLWIDPWKRWFVERSRAGPTTAAGPATAGAGP